MKSKSLVQLPFYEVVELAKSCKEFILEFRAEEDEKRVQKEIEWRKQYNNSGGILREIFGFKPKDTDRAAVINDLMEVGKRDWSYGYPCKYYSQDLELCDTILYGMVEHNPEFAYLTFEDFRSLKVFKQ